MKNNYIKTFNDLNKLNIKYSSIFYLNNNNNINFLNEINIDFNKIKRITIKIKHMERYDFIDNDNFTKNNKNFFENLYSFTNIKNNLIYLNICYRDDYYKNINNDLFEDINKFKSLKYLFLESFSSDNNFVIKLNTLKSLSIKKCKNINISEMTNENLEALDLRNNNRISIEKIDY